MRREWLCNNSDTSSINPSHKGEIYDRAILDKPCVICRMKQSMQANKMFLCDGCDDGYHEKCIGRMDLDEAKVFLCPICSQERAKYDQIQAKKQEIEAHKRQHCFKCGDKILENNPIEYMPGIFCRTDDKQEKIMILKDDRLQVIKCRACQQYFHKSCFSRRTNCTCCSNCELQIRKNTPKSHIGFINWLESDLRSIGTENLYPLKPYPATHLLDFQTTNKAKTKLYGLKCFQVPCSWQLIVRYEASLYFALKANQFKYCYSQLYPNKQIMKLNCWFSDSRFPMRLRPEDERQFEKYLSYIQAHRIAHFQIKEDTIKGFYVVATSEIPKGTIICEYVGEVCTKREYHKHIHNDSIMSLTERSLASESLDIAPIKYANMSRFVSGINNEDKVQKKMQNIDSLNFSYKGRCRVIYYAIKDIAEQSELYLDYNKGICQEYPTEHFT